jgi:hypothetical protein
VARTLFGRTACRYDDVEREKIAELFVGYAI